MSRARLAKQGSSFLMEVGMKKFIKAFTVLNIVIGMFFLTGNVAFVSCESLLSSTITSVRVLNEGEPIHFINQYPVTLTVGHDTFTMNNFNYNLIAPTQIVRGRAMSPICAIVKSVGYNVGWDSETNTVSIKMCQEDNMAKDFKLSISVEEDVLSQGSDFRINVEFKNISGEYAEITYTWLGLPHIPNWKPFGGVAIDPPYPQTRLLAPNDTISNVGICGRESGEWLIGHDLEIGTHELTFRAVFVLDGQNIELWSNTIFLIVQ